MSEEENEIKTYIKNNCWKNATALVLLVAMYFFTKYRMIYDIFRLLD